MKNIKHKIAHILGCYTGTIESFYIGDILWTGFKCSICGEINHAQPSVTQERARKIMNRHQECREILDNGFKTHYTRGFD